MTAPVKGDALALQDLERPVFTGEGAGWRVRDLMPHFAFWWRLAARGARRAKEIGAAPDQNTTLDLRAALAHLPAGHHTEHIDAALAREGAST